MISDRKWAGVARSLVEMLAAGRANIRFAITAPPMHPATWTGSRRHNLTGALLTAPILTDLISSVKIESMKAELISGLTGRAAVHAALADPARLQIIDTLAAGDTCPSELAAMLAMGSNLL